MPWSTKGQAADKGVSHTAVKAMKRYIIRLVVCLAIGASGVSQAFAAVQGEQCIRLEKMVESCSVGTKNKTHAQLQQCKAHKVSFTRSCAKKPVCCQPAFFCAPGDICPDIMPPVKTYGSLEQCKVAGAEFLYYGSCVAR